MVGALRDEPRGRVVQSRHLQLRLSSDNGKKLRMADSFTGGDVEDVERDRTRQISAATESEIQMILHGYDPSCFLRFGATRRNYFTAAFGGRGESSER